MDYKKFSNELLFTYHKNIDFVYKVLGEVLFQTNNFSKKFSKVYKTSEGKVLVSWDKYNDWGITLNENVSRNRSLKLSISEDLDDYMLFNPNNSFKFIYNEIENLDIPENLTDDEAVNKFYDNLYATVSDKMVDSDLTITLLDEIDYCKASKFSPQKVRQRLKKKIYDYYKK